MTRHAPWRSCVFMFHSFTTRTQWMLTLLSWNMPEPSGEKIHWWDNLVIQYIQEICCAYTWPTEATPDHNTTICKLLLFFVQAVYNACCSPYIQSVLTTVSYINMLWLFKTVGAMAVCHNKSLMKGSTVPGCISLRVIQCVFMPTFVKFSVLV